ncbi:TIGR04283 family arsenosugar biosynthesis glycosyltransferase [Clostridium niameyense]|uniref:TIGR04283 family arsenosugar biosynthesis glycosyltransferase n=1 Tax=Clostridium niameyense TaxID=1622073 RepID=UPI00067F5B58|nr:TIGR04283 family arsenosugar biosynthesis glycosyltransferase [Clostridium niameyense]
MVSIIIPVLNEEKTIENLLKNLQRLKGNKEIIIVDGGSIDNTFFICQKYGKLLKSKKGRSNQMNVGAKVAKGDILWFVHSDSIVNKNSIDIIEKTIKLGYIGGGFNLYFYDLGSKFMDYIRKTSNLRAKKLKIFYGDQGIFIKKEVFQRIEGYSNLEIMEDLDLSIRLRKIGNMKLVSCTIGTSARRFKNYGEFKTHILMHKLRILYFLGVSTKKLSRIYREAR